MISEQRIGTTAQAHEAVERAGIGDAFAFTPEISV